MLVDEGPSPGSGLGVSQRVYEGSFKGYYKGFWGGFDIGT